MGEENKRLEDQKMDGDGEGNFRRNYREGQQKRRLSLEEYEAQYRQRVNSEIEVFGYAMARLEQLVNQNPHMQDFILRVFRSVETTFVTTTENQQCASQTSALANE